MSGILRSGDGTSPMAILGIPNPILDLSLDLRVMILLREASVVAGGLVPLEVACQWFLPVGRKLVSLVQLLLEVGLRGTRTVPRFSIRVKVWQLG